MKCEKIIEKIVKNGGVILEETTEKNKTVSIHKTVLQLNKTFFKFIFVNIPTKQLEAIKLYKTNVDEEWKELDETLVNF